MKNKVMLLTISLLAVVSSLLQFSAFFIKNGALVLGVASLMISFAMFYVVKPRWKS